MLDEINKFIKEFFNKYYDNKKIFFDNLAVIYFLSDTFIDDIGEYFDKGEFSINWSSISNADFITNKDLINNFYKYLNINFNMDDVINDGTFNLTITDKEKVIKEGLEDYLIDGTNIYLDFNNKSIDVYNNGIITDSVIWIHELTHYRNQEDDGRSDECDLLSETISFTYELIYLDYLEKLGYNKDVSNFRYDKVRNHEFSNVIACWYISQLLILYNEVGDISKESYEYFYEDDNYENIINHFIYFILDNERFKNNVDKEKLIFDILEYSLASTLSIYLYIEYKKNNKFIEKIEEFNEFINDVSLEESLVSIGFNNSIENGIFNEENLEKIKNNLVLFRDIINNDYKKVNEDKNKVLVRS